MGNNTNYLSVRISQDLYGQFKDYCKSRNISIAFAMELLVDECIKNKNVPFSIGSENEANLRYSGNESRQSIFIESSKREHFRLICEDYICLKMANVVKAFMIYCVTYKPMLPYSFDRYR